MKPLSCSNGDVKEPLKKIENGKLSDEMEGDEVASNGNIISEVKQPLQGKDAEVSEKYTDEDCDVESGQTEEKTRNRCWQLAMDPFVILATGWRTYVSQKVVLSGLALALLYMTVLGFDYVTTGK